MNSLNIDFKKKSAKGRLSIKLFKNDSFWIGYIPSLNISSYAKTYEEAHEFLLSVYLKEYLQNAFNSPSQAIEELKSLGWERNSIFKKKFTVESYVDKDGFLKEFDLPIGTEVTDSEIFVG